MENLKTIPEIDPNFVPGKTYEKIRNIIQSGIWFPTWIYGPTGAGKTHWVTQACANLRRSVYRASIIATTGEDELIGGMVLENGSTRFEYGPVVKAMLEGEILILDEIDLATPRIMCLQSMLDSRKIHIHRTKETIVAKDGFQVFATANTKGNAEDTRYVGTNAMNVAFTNRFDCFIKAEYLPNDIETRILLNHGNQYKIDPVVLAALVDNLMKWTNKIRESYGNGSIAETISTRNLIGAIKSFAISNSEDVMIVDVTSRFERSIMESMAQMYDTVRKPLMDTNGNVKTMPKKKLM